MCGIFGYIGKNNDGFSYALQALRNISYRGYDSYGFAYDNNGNIMLLKDKGDIEQTPIRVVASQKVIAHTRWATHGKPSQANAHPHTYGDIYIVHNGTIDNYLKLKELDIIKDDMFYSQTDSEVLAHLVHHYHKEHDLLESLRLTCAHLQGSYAIIAMDKKQHMLAFAKNGSPLIVGIDKRGGYYLCSDILGFPYEHVDDVIYLENGQLGVVNACVRFITQHGDSIEKRRIQMPKNIETSDKGRFKHYMQKEIYDQRETLRRLTINAEDDIRLVGEYIRKHRYIIFTGCGSAYNVCLAAKYIFSQIDTSKKRFYFAETPSHLGLTTPDTVDTLVICVTQSGETADLIFGLEQLQHAHTCAILNTLYSTIHRMVTHSIFIGCGPEKAVASTKAISAQLATMYLLAHYLCGDFQSAQKDIMNISSEISDLLNPRYETYIKRVAHALQNKKHIFIVGKKTNYAMALEASIKLAEVTYIHAQAFDSSEFKHGPFALIDEKQHTPVIALMGDPCVDDTYDIMLTQLEEMKAKGASIIGIGPLKHTLFDLWLRVPEGRDYASLMNLIPLQLLSYHIGLARKQSIDKPRNLAKSVTTR